MSDFEGMDRADEFSEIIGYPELKQELLSYARALVQRQNHGKSGIGLPKGIILEGPSGVGKTTLAQEFEKLIPGENYYIDCFRNAAESISVPFRKAEANKPALIVLDNIDNTDAEAYQVILAGMNEPENNEVFVLATATSVDKLPDALLSPDRLGTIIRIHRPYALEVDDIVEFYLDQILGSKMEEPDCPVDVRTVQRLLHGETPAYIKNVLQRAVIKSGNNNDRPIYTAAIAEAFLDSETGSITAEENENTYHRQHTAYYVAGQVVLSEHFNRGNLVLASIRGKNSEALGTLRFDPGRVHVRDYAFYYTNLEIAVVGKAAEEIHSREPATGVSTDLKRAFQLAKILIAEDCTGGFDSWKADNYPAAAEALQIKSDEMISGAYKDVKQILNDSWEAVEKVAKALMEKTTILSSNIARWA